MGPTPLAAATAAGHGSPAPGREYPRGVSRPANVGDAEPDVAECPVQSGGVGSSNSRVLSLPTTHGRPHGRPHDKKDHRCLCDALGVTDGAGNGTDNASSNYHH